MRAIFAFALCVLCFFPLDYNKCVYNFTPKKMSVFVELLTDNCTYEKKVTWTMRNVIVHVNTEKYGRINFRQCQKNGFRLHI